MKIITKICNSGISNAVLLTAVLLTACTTHAPLPQAKSVEVIGSIFVEHFEFEYIGDRQPTRDDSRQLKCLADNIYYESAQETTEGQIAVAQVTMNRVATGRWGKDVCSVVYYKSNHKGKTVCQFSWACEKPTRTKVLANWVRSQDAARLVYSKGYRIVDLKGALYFHARHVDPKWRQPRIRTIGNHVFYGEKK